MAVADRSPDLELQIVRTLGGQRPRAIIIAGSPIEGAGEGGVAGARELLARGVDGIEVAFAVNDMMAIGAMTAFRDAGRTPGSDIAVAGFDDIASAVDVVPALTSVRVALRDVGIQAMQLALADDNPGVVPIGAEVVLRDSTPAITRLG
jgi:LacI family transcriptional regulator